MRIRGVARASLLSFLLGLIACAGGRRGPRETSTSDARPEPTESSASNDLDKPKEESKTDPKQRRRELEKRLKAAIDRDGHPQGWEMTEAVAGCRGGGPKCTTIVNKVQGISEACFLGGQVLFFLRDGDLDEAESRLERVEASAEKMGPIRKEAAAQQKAVTDAAYECEKDRTPCKSRCDKENDLPACIAYGVALYVEDKKFADARPYLKKGCDGNYEVSCNLLKDVDKVEAEDKKSATARIDAAWSSLKSIGDDLATKKFLHAFAATNLKGPRNARATQNMAAHIASITKDDFCPAMREFLKVSSRAELAKRAKAHCDDDPPTAAGLAGKEEVLTAECSVVFATPCP